MDLARNAFKAALAEDRLQIGLWMSLCSNIVADILGDSGFDWILVDTEHSPNELTDVLAQLQALRGGTATPIVRPAWNDPVLIKRILDIGASCILIPYVQNAEEAARAVAATRYPPNGMRGVTGSGRAARYGRVKGYLQRAGEEMCVLVQIETRAALDNLEEIAAVPNVDGIFIGPADLAASLGHLGNPQHPEVQAAIADAAARLRRLGKPAGILSFGAEATRQYVDWGFRFVAVGSDLALLASGADRLAAEFKA